MSGGSVMAQELLFRVDFDSYFDNREYNSCEGMASRSGSDFALRLAPRIDYVIDSYSSLNVGVDMVQPMGGDDLFGEVRPIIYYSLKSDRWVASVGVFGRQRIMMGGYSTAFFSSDYLFEHHLIEGLQGRYNVGDSYVEAVLDWQGGLSATTRERFQLLSSARLFWSRLYVGYNLSMMHFAGADNPTQDNVVDNILLNPCIGVRYSMADVDLEFKTSYLQALQRDRSFGNEWINPSMVEMALMVGYNGFSLDERLYLGDDIIPLYGGHTLESGVVLEYGEALYSGDRFFRADGGFYNRTALQFERGFCRDRVALRVALIAHIDGSGVGYEQSFGIRVKLGGKLKRN